MACPGTGSHTPGTASHFGLKTHQWAFSGWRGQSTTSPAAYGGPCGHPAQVFGDRARQTEEARAAIVARLGRIPGLDLPVVEAGQADGETEGTRLFTALGSALADVPADRIAGAIMITDGRVHDVCGMYA